MNDPIEELKKSVDKECISNEMSVDGRRAISFFIDTLAKDNYVFPKDTPLKDLPDEVLKAIPDIVKRVVEDVQKTHIIIPRKELADDIYEQVKTDVFKELSLRSAELWKRKHWGVMYFDDETGSSIAVNYCKRCRDVNIYGNEECSCRWDIYSAMEMAVRKTLERLLSKTETKKELKG